MRTIGEKERRARLAQRHGLLNRLDGVDEAANAMVGLHSSDPATVYLSARARVAGFSVAELERALYEDRTLVRLLGMRRTMFVVPRDLAAVMDASCTKALVDPERRRLEGLIAQQGLTDDPPAWVRRVCDATAAALGEAGEATTRELSEVVPELKLKLRFGSPDKKWAGTVGMSTRVMFLLATEGRIIRGRPLGTWISSQYRWSRIENWLGEPLHVIDEQEASRDLVSRWLRGFGPGTLEDLKWWTGWTVAKTRNILQAVGAVEVGLDEGTGWVLPDDIEPVDDPGRFVALLPGLDPTVMGWKRRDWYLGDHAKALFDRNGNAGPTVWVDGRIAGGWAQRASGEVVYELLEDVGSEATAAIGAEAAVVEAWLGDTVVTPRFRTPLEKRLANDGPI
jgi:hypothetical protein